MKRPILFIIALLLALPAYRAYGYHDKAPDLKISNDIRVCVCAQNTPMVLSVRGPYCIINTDTGTSLKEGSTFFNASVRPWEKGITIGKDSFNAGSIDIVPKDEPSIYLDKRLYRGRLRLIRNPDETLTAVNIVSIEDYLKGVLYHEVSNRWPIESIKAQAIASRTFALYQAHENRTRDYDLKADVSSQVYGGVWGEKYRTNIAVDQTRGLILIYDKKILPAFFHAACGGRTEDASVLWKVDMIPLKGVRCYFCTNSPYYKWSCIMPLKKVEEALRRGGQHIADIKYMEVTKRDASGRALWVLVKGNDKRSKVKVKDLRAILGPVSLKSANLDVHVEKDEVMFEGRGWGHGVGMCQWGSFTLAKKGKTAEEILRYYYPGAKIVDLACR